MLDDEKTVASVYWRDEILQVMYWMLGEGFGQEVTLAELRKFLQAEASVLQGNLDVMLANGLLEQRSRETYSLTEQGKKEGGRRFADEFGAMLKPGHFECNEPDCECHDADSIEGACKHLMPS